ncbi:MAG: hypothetical protein Harvfovirus3_73 [Harvfovirus sp.]|uniref:Uncharacterized protein n=1 Tax=Harvfovirus sp. TaxID=2487768 RepID=A0A3G5A0B7_9VIRU|nr:MAG: hypothetical protein Harvfovirus3_73 [Harvfovirus sp.]
MPAESGTIAGSNVPPKKPYDDINDNLDEVIARLSKGMESALELFKTTGIHWLG